MSLDYTHDPENNILIIRIKHLINLDQIKDSFVEVFSSGELPHDINTLYDLQDMDFSNITTEFEKRLIMFRESLNRGNAKIACVVATDLGYGMGRMYEALSDHLPQQVRIFRSMNEAKDWLK